MIESVYDLPIPTGSTSNRWYAVGYQAALIDIRNAIERGGIEAVQGWLTDNTVNNLDSLKR